MPSYTTDSDLSWHLAKVLVDPVDQAPPFVPGSSSLPVPIVEEKSSDVEILGEAPVLKSSRKRRARKPKNPLDVKFLRRSQRTNKGHDFKNDASAEAVAVPSVPDEPIPLQVCPPAGSSLVTHRASASSSSIFQGHPASLAAPPPPHLPASILQSLGTQFVKMPVVNLPGD